MSAFVARQPLEIDVEAVGQFEKELGAEGALIALDQVEIAGRDLQALGHLRLIQAKVAAQAAEPRAGKDFIGSFSRH